MNIVTSIVYLGFVTVLFTPCTATRDPYGTDVQALDERLKVLENRYEELARENEQLKAKLQRKDLEDKEMRQEMMDQKAQITALQRTIVRGDPQARINRSTESTANIVTQNRIRKDVSSGIAFHSRLSRDLNNVGRNQAIVFDHVVLNEGNGYNYRDGVFVTPVPGVYVFYWNLMSQDHRGMDTTLDPSIGELGYGFVSPAPTSYQNGGDMVIVRLNAGVHVWLKKADNYGDVLHERFSTFSGFLLYETDV